MALEKFEMKSLNSIDDGRIKEAWQQAVERCRADCHDRPGVDKPREVIIKMSMVPICDPDGSMASCDVSFQIDEKLPKRQSPTYNMKAGRGGLLFNELSREDVYQMTLDEVPGPRSQEDVG